MARKSDIITKVCTKSGESFKGTFDELTEFFYRDKSQKDGLSPWCKAAERAYNKAYRAGLKGADAPRKRDIVNDEGMTVFENAMSPERVTRKSRKARAEVTTAPKRTRTRKASV